MQKTCLTLPIVLSLASGGWADPRDVMVVLDVSGSMWGQIDGVTKIEIARDVFADVSRDWDAEGISAGLIAYGHRRKGDCSDIELLAPVSAASTAQLGPLVNSLTPRGKTPLSDAVRMAAQELKFTEEAATVILLTDGVETCNADPCALGAELERLGVDFTTHVIGFDITDPADKAPLQCLAAATGGRYLDSGDASALSDALRQVTAAPDPQPQTPGSYKVHINLDYAEGTTRPQSVRFQARRPDSGEIRDLGTLTGIEQIMPGLTTDLEEGDWLIEALSDEGQGTLEITHREDQDIWLPFAAYPARASIQDGSPYQLGSSFNVYVTATGLQPGIELPVMLLDETGTQLDWETRFGGDGPGLTVHDFASPQTAGTYRIVVGDPAAPIAERVIVFTPDAIPEWRGARTGQPGGSIPTHISGNTYYYNTLTLSQDGSDVHSQKLDWNGDPLHLPDQPGVYDLTYSYTDAAGTAQVADLGTITVAGRDATLPDDPDSIAPPPGMADSGQDPDTMQALDAEAHGWVPSSPDATADPALLRDVDIEDVVFRCRAETCSYDDPVTGASGIPLLGDFALLRPEITDDGRLFIEIVNEMNGEWVVLNPIMQTDMVTDCVSFGTEGWHSTSGGAETDMACTVRDATGYTFTQMETLASWAIDRNAAAQEAARADHDAAMGEDAPGTPPGRLQGNWIVTDSQTGATLMHWQVMQDAGAAAAYVDLAGQPGTAFADVSGVFGDAPTLTIAGSDAETGPSAFQISKTVDAGVLYGMFSRPGGWDTAHDIYTGMLQLSGIGAPVTVSVTLSRAGADVSADPAARLRGDAETRSYSIAVPDGAAGGMIEILDETGAPVAVWMADPGIRLVDLPQGDYTARWNGPDGQTTDLPVTPAGAAE